MRLHQPQLVQTRPPGVPAGHPPGNTPYSSKSEFPKGAVVFMKTTAPLETHFSMPPPPSRSGHPLENSLFHGPPPPRADLDTPWTYQQVQGGGARVAAMTESYETNHLHAGFPGHAFPGVSGGACGGPTETRARRGIHFDLLNSYESLPKPLPLWKLTF